MYQLNQANENTTVYLSKEQYRKLWVEAVEQMGEKLVASPARVACDIA